MSAGGLACSAGVCARAARPCFGWGGMSLWGRGREAHHGGVGVSRRRVGCVVLQVLRVKKKKKKDAARAWIKEAGRMNHLKHSVPSTTQSPYAHR